MAAANVFNIEEGKFALTIVGDSDPGDWQGPGGESLETVALSDYVSGTGIDFSCQVTSGAINASPNTSPKTTPATFCEPEITTTQVGVTSYTLDATVLQDPHVKAGISRFLFEHDTKLAYFYLGLDNEEPPKSMGKVRVVAGSFGGDARTDLTATLSLPIEVKPDIEFGIEGNSQIITGASGVVGPVTSAAATAGTPGTWSPAGSTPPASVSALQGALPAVAANPNTAWTTGQYVQTGTAGAPGEAYWDGDTWEAGRAT